ncbi:DUF4167 domain-containing protein [Rhizobium dioscoreae]|uniref:DUF4167 domain-containing protein n=1 Tax=Rhizobium TaxID=379 RepID=UPI0033326693
MFKEQAVKSLNCQLVSTQQPHPPTHKTTFDTTASKTTFASLKRRYEQFQLLAHERARAGDQIEAENMFQHAEHYYRAAALQKAGYNR